MNEKIGMAELLAVRNLDGDSKGSTRMGAGALWAIAVVIIVALIIWLVGGGGLFGGINKSIVGTDGILNGGAEAEEVRRLRTNDQILAEFYKQKIVNHEQLEDAIKCVNKNIVDTSLIVTERAFAYADKGDCNLGHKETVDVFKLQEQINILECRKIDKESKQVQFCPDTTGCPTSSTAVVGNAISALNTNMELLSAQIEKLGK